MKVFAENIISDFAISRISGALKKYSPADTEFVDVEADADLVIIYIHGQRRYTWWRVDKLIKEHKKYAVVQLSLRSTTNPGTGSWFNIWGNAEVVWSYYDLLDLCAEDGNQANFNFYHAPLGVDTNVFKETAMERKYIAGIHSKDWSREGLREVVTAARAVRKRVLNIGPVKDLGDSIDYTGIVDDQTLARSYSQCKYVTGLRHTEGFEMPVIEGLMCGARPICYDGKHYRMWFEGLAEFIPENSREDIIGSLTELFNKEPRPVTNDEKRFVKDKFNWEKISNGFWERII